MRHQTTKVVTTIIAIPIILFSCLFSCDWLLFLYRIAFYVQLYRHNKNSSLSMCLSIKRRFCVKSISRRMIFWDFIIAPSYRQEPIGSFRPCANPWYRLDTGCRYMRRTSCRTRPTTCASYSLTILPLSGIVCSHGKGESPPHSYGLM